MYIDGEWCDAKDGATLESINPATGKAWATAAVAGEAEVNRAIAAAARALRQGSWAEMNATQRGKLLRKLGDLIAENASHLGNIETTDSGKLARETRAQTGYVADYYYYFAGLADKIQGATLPIDKPDMHVFTKRVPIGVVAAVVPWNAQMFLTATKLGPALAAGNTVVLKASEQAPAPMFEFAKIVEQAGFPRVLSTSSPEWVNPVDACSPVTPMLRGWRSPAERNPHVILFVILLRILLFCHSNSAVNLRLWYLKTRISKMQ